MTKKVLEINDLRISFKTDNGLVQAVRGVSFDLHEGETLCIVGESGSGKSVTSKTIMGILSANAIVEEGNIIYEGENLLEVSEEEYHKIRGHKIGMIFQDPLSSLNPIVRIGKQITEATLINADLLKRQYNDLISNELIAYKNAISHCRVNINKVYEKYLRNVAFIKADFEDKKLTAEEKTALNEKIKIEKDAYKKEVAKWKAELDEKLPALKDALNTKKKIAKQAVSDYKAKTIGEYKVGQDSLKKQLASAGTENEKKQIIEKMNALKKDYVNKMFITKSEAKRRAIEIMREVGIPMPEKRFKQYPFQFSGGMRQRIVIAIALTANPDILICDEPTTALDVTIQAQILDLINRLKKERSLSCVFITHDLGVVANMADRVAVMYAGKIVEYGTAHEIFFEPKHPYTWALLSSIPDVDSKERLEAIPGTPPDMIYPPKGDAFAQRSKYAMEIDFKYEPPFFKLSDTHYAATWLLHPNAPKVKMPKIVSQRVARAKEENNNE